MLRTDQGAQPSNKGSNIRELVSLILLIPLIPLPEPRADRRLSNAVIGPVARVERSETREQLTPDFAPFNPGY
jgi:hypothetical protein